ncbi:MAG: EAL domain-containing protein [Acidimicrobiales bacterium]
MNILLVEDSEGDASLVTAHLGIAAPTYDVRRVETLAAATEHLQWAHCILLDLGLPDAHGLEGVKALLEIPHQAAVVVLTADHRAELAAEALALGATDYLRKGTADHHRLATVVAQAVERNKLHRRILDNERWAEMRAARHAAVATLGALAVSGGPLDELLDTTVLRAVDGFESSVATILVPADGTLRVLAEAGLGDGWSDDGFADRSLAAVLGGGRAVYVAHHGQGAVPAPAIVADRGPVATIAAPIHGASVPLGLLTLHTASEVERQEEAVDFVQSMANVLAHAFELQQASAELAHRAITDDLTGLANRSLFRDRLANALAQRIGSSCAVIFADLDGFKDVNDALGHGVGDKVLRLVGQRLAASLREGDTVARLGGDEFAILCPSVADEVEAAMVAERTLAVLESAPFEIEEGQIDLSASLGVALGGPELGPEGLLRDADAAMYRAKAAGGGQVSLYDDTMHAAARERFELSNDLRHALMRDELSVLFQPIVGLADRRLVWAEALVRWDHPTRGRLGPDRFLDIGERAGLLAAMDTFVLGTAVAELEKWTARGARAAPSAVTVNVTAQQLRDGDLPRRCAEALAATALPPGAIWLEVAERSLARDHETATASLEALSDLGLGLALDDFGTGYSSLSHVGTMPFAALKIDRSFVSGSGPGLANPRIVAAIIEVAHSLGEVAIGKGVETSEQYEALRELGCDLAQGFHISEPLPASQIGPWTAQWHSTQGVIA